MMNIYIRRIAFMAVAALTLSSCLDTVYPTNGKVQEQVNSSSKAIDGLNNAIAQQMMSFGYGYGACGFAGQMLQLDAQVGQIPITKTPYDYFASFCECNYMGPTYTYCYDTWSFYYNIISKANLVIASATDVSSASDDNAPALGNALAYRAMAYLYLTQLYQYRNTSYAQLDNQAAADSVVWLTVPIVTEKTTKDEGFRNPRAPYYKMYRFILTDLNRADTLLQGYTRNKANEASEAFVKGLKARFWLLLGSYFEQEPDLLSGQMAHESDASLATYNKLGIASAGDCFRLAIQSAEAAMQGLAPMTKTEWYNAKTGFNTATSSWLLAEQISSDDIKDETDNTLDDNWSWKNFASFISADADFGIAGVVSYGASRQIDKQLYGKICPADWRKHTWIAPEDAGQADSAYKYNIDMTSQKFAEFPALVGLKFKPGQANCSDYKTGAAVDIPVMRVEEMYFIEAEAAAHVNGVAAGVKLLDSFMNNYRCDKTAENSSPYHCDATTMSTFITELITQKRIEFWGEGLTFFDYKRLKMGYSLNYEGTNHPSNYQFSFKDGYVSPGMNYCIPNYELQYNSAIRNNPDPSGVLQ